MTELEGKYQKLASEYAKIRSQVNVLKKAVIDEQAEAERLRDLIKEKEQSLRKYEQEIDSLSFRNQQLSLRVTSLQKQHDETSQLTNHKNKKMSSSVSDFRLKAGAMDEELRLKIEENINLHRQVASSEIEHRNEILLLDEKLLSLENENKKLNLEIEKLNKFHQQFLQEFSEEKANLETKVLQKEIHNKELLTTIYDLEMKNNKCDSTPNISSGSNDEKKLCVVIVGLVKWSHEFVCILDDVLSNVDERCSLQNFYNNSPSLLHASKLLHCSIESYNSSSKYLSLLISKLSKISMPLLIFDHFNDLLPLLKNYFISIEQVLNNQINCLQAESGHSSFPLDLIELNNFLILSIHNLLLNFQAIYIQFEDKIQSLDLSNNNFMDELLDSYDLCILSVSNMNSTFHEFEANVKKKFEIENGLPTTSESMKKTNANISSSFHQFILIVTQLESSFEIEVNHPSTEDLLINSFNPIILSQQSEENKEEILNSEVKLKEFLESEIKKLEQKLSDLETEKGHWALDMHLLRFKYEKHIQKLMVNSKQNSTLNMSDELSCREEEIVSYHKNVLHTKLLQLQMAESKAVHFQAECVSLQQWLLFNENQIKKLELKLEECHQNISLHKDELATTSLNYESQLSMMSEHLASLNDTIVKQKDEIDALHFQIQNKNSKATINKKIYS